MTTLADALVGVTRLGLDTAPIIYFVEANPRYDALVTEIFQRVVNGTLTGVTSAITLTEVLVQPLRHGQTKLAQEYADFLLHSTNLGVVSIDTAIAEHAAAIRARYPIGTPDALQIAVALTAGCQAFLTNDKSLRRVAELRVLVLDDLKL